MRVAPMLFAWTKLRARGAVQLDPEDLLQEVWCRALDRLQSFDPSRSFRAWIFGIAKNTLIHSLDPSRRPPSPLQSGSGVGPFDTLTSVSLRLGKDEALQRFVDYVQALDADDRTLLIYCGLEGYTCERAAKRMGISTDAATKRWQILRARLGKSGVLEKLALELRE